MNEQVLRVGAQNATNSPFHRWPIAVGRTENAAPRRYAIRSTAGWWSWIAA